QAHDPSRLDPRFGLVRDRRRRLAARQGDARGEDRAARRMRCGVEVAPLRAEPREDAEQVTQALRGDELRVEQERDGWARVVTGYDYAGWMRAEHLVEGLPVELARTY